LFPRRNRRSRPPLGVRPNNNTPSSIPRDAPCILAPHGVREHQTRKALLQNHHSTRFRETAVSARPGHGARFLDRARINNRQRAYVSPPREKQRFANVAVRSERKRGRRDAQGSCEPKHRPWSFEAGERGFGPKAVTKTPLAQIPRIARPTPPQPGARG